MKLSDEDFTFRAIVDKLVIIKDKSIIEKMDKAKLNENSDSILTYCYVDDQAEITFEYLCPFKIDTMAMFVQKDKNISTKLRFVSVINYELTLRKSKKCDKI